MAQMRADNYESIRGARREAAADVDLMMFAVQRKVRQEEERRGLVILKAVYGRLPAPLPSDADVHVAYVAPAREWLCQYRLEVPGSSSDHADGWVGVAKDEGAPATPPIVAAPSLVAPSQLTNLHLFGAIANTSDEDWDGENGGKPDDGIPEPDEEELTRDKVKKASQQLMSQQEKKKVKRRRRED